MSLTRTSAGVTQNDLAALSAASGIKHFTLAFISSALNAPLGVTGAENLNATSNLY
jgi:hypothetical protein